MIDAAILAGGRGARLREAFDGPKVLAPVAGRPFLSYLLDQVVAAGVGRVVLCTGHRGAEVQRAIGDRHGTVRLLYSQESMPCDTAGALRLALPLLRSDPVLVLNGDSYCDVPLADVVGWHRGRAASCAGALLVNRVDDAARFGTVDRADDGTIVSFREKAGRAEAGWINAGVYLLSRRLLTSIPTGEPVSLERDVFQSWVGRGLTAYPVVGPFLDIGTPESYAQAAAFFARHRPSAAARM